MARVARDRPDVIINCAAYNLVDAAEDDAAAGARLSTRSPFGRSRVRPLKTAPRWCTTAPILCSTERALSRIREEDAPNPQSVYAPIEADRRVVCARGAARVRAARREPVRRRRRQELDRSHRRGDCERQGSQGFAIEPFRRAMSSMSRRQPGRSSSAASQGCITASAPATPRGSRWRRRSLASWARSAKRVCVPVSVADVRLRASRPQFAALANEKLSRIVADADMAGCAAQVFGVKFHRAWQSARSSPASPVRTARISPSCSSKKATRSSASSGG